MSLPVVPLPRDVVTVEGADVPVRGLSRGEALSLRALGDDVEAIEALLLALGTDTPAEEAKAWHHSAPSHVVEPIVAAIVRLSALDGDAQFPGGTGTGAG